MAHDSLVVAQRLQSAQALVAAVRSLGCSTACGIFASLALLVAWTAGDRLPATLFPLHPWQWSPKVIVHAARVAPFPLALCRIRRRVYIRDPDT